MVFLSCRTPTNCVIYCYAQAELLLKTFFLSFVPRVFTGFFIVATRAKTICRHPGCGVLIGEAGYCEKHQKQAVGWFRTSLGSSTARGYGGRWRWLRKHVLERDLYLCCECKKRGRLTSATEVDHVVPKYQGGTDDSDNLQSLCKECHKTKTAREGRGG